MPQALSLHLLTSVKSQTESTRQTPIATGTECQTESTATVLWRTEIEIPTAGHSSWDFFIYRLRKVTLRYYL